MSTCPKGERNGFGEPLTFSLPQSFVGQEMSILFFYPTM